MADIVFQGVTKIYDNGVCALDNLNLSIHHGELLVLVGPSGCGKTTTLRLIAGLEAPTTGTISVGGRSMDGVPPWKRDVAMVLQRPALSPAKTVRANMNFGNDLRRGFFGKLQRFFSASTRRERRDESRCVDEIARLLGLQDVLDRRPAELSGGQLQRVALGRALMGNCGLKTSQPHLNPQSAIRNPQLLLDEPLGQLDGPLRRQLRRELHLLHRQFPATMIYVTHDSEEALALGERIAVLHHGVLLQVDSAEALLTRPRHRFVAEFFPTGAGPMNFLEGRIVEEAGELVFETGPAKLALPSFRGEIWRKNLGRTVCVAVRPEDVCIQWSKPSYSQGWPMRVELVEPRTNGSLVSCEDQGLRLAGFVPRTEGNVVAVGTTVGVDAGLGQAGLFDPINGVNLEW